MIFRFLKLHKWCQIVQSVTINDKEVFLRKYKTSISCFQRPGCISKGFLHNPCSCFTPLPLPPSPPPKKFPCHSLSCSNYEFHSFRAIYLTLSWRMPLSFRNQSNDLLRKSMDWFLYNGLRHERVKTLIVINTNTR